MTPLLQTSLIEQAAKWPDRTALVCGTDRMTYGTLDGLSNRLARALGEAGCRAGDRVALLMPKSPIAIASILGIYKAGGIYVPLDPSSPPSRLIRILESCESRWLLAADIDSVRLEEIFRDERRRQRLMLGWLQHGAPDADHARPAFSLGDVAASSAAPVACPAASDDPAHVLFTSGSTGAPKGVVITHANVIRFIEWATRYFGMDASDRVSAHPPLHFDLSFFDIFGAFAVGAELHLIPADVSLLPNRLADLIRTSNLTQWFSVPSVLTYLARFDAIRMNDFPALKRLLWCGEVFPTPGVMYWMGRLPHVQFTNLYGPTETTIASSFHTLRECPYDPQASIPIGRACDGEELLVLDDFLQPVRPGETGNLHIGGAGLSPGYWRDPERTAAVFLRHPQRPSERIYRTGDLARIDDDGLVHFLGRTDSQIKSRGYRIELGEIEAALNAVASVQEGAVVALNTTGFEGSAICCAYVPAAGVRVTPTALRRELSHLLPSYMLPARWMAFEQFPRNANGKIDRPRLREAFESHAAHAS
jgi:amino acid adenylation domain-containing protein